MSCDERLVFLRRHSDGKFFRGARYWRWTRWWRFAAVLPASFWVQMIVPDDRFKIPQKYSLVTLENLKEVGDL